jgi:phage terminase large subunit-like protein
MDKQTRRRRSSTQSSAQPDAPEGEIVATFIESFCRLSKGDQAGQLIKLRPWQREILNDLFAHRPDGKRKYRRGLLLMPRKNGKSLLAAGIALYSLFQEIGAEVAIVAGDRAQARIIFRECSRMVELDPILSRKLHVLRDVIEYPETGSVLRVLSSDASRAEGFNFSTVLFDEIHVQPNDRLWSTVNLGSGARRNPLVLGISTAGTKTDSSGQDSLCYKLWQYGQRLESGEQQDDAFYFRCFSAPEDLAWDSPEAARAANPAYGDFLDPEDFAAAARSIPRHEYETKRLCRWVYSADPFVPAGTWDACANPELSLAIDEEIVLGFDGSFSSDSTAIVGVRISDKAVFVLGHWERAIDGDLSWRVPIEEVEARMVELCSTYAVRELVCDPFRWQRSMEVWAQQGLPVVEFPQTPSRMVPATAGVYDAVVNGNLSHTGDPRLARHVANAAPYYSRAGLMVRKETKNSLKRIDLLAATIMAHSRACTLATAPAAKAAPKVEYIEL